ncbi:MAG: DUF971 domain-containing protein, partial [Blastocatellia bacterium]|nr:DUF971 domain-containing protein [Blastocatellia bacterium]
TTSKESKEPGTKPRRSLQMFKPEKYQIEEMYFVGNYALGINWQDKHKSIYPWMLLGEI